jgi:hypothetical protein
MLERGEPSDPTTPKLKKGLLDINFAEFKILRYKKHHI